MSSQSPCRGIASAVVASLAWLWLSIAPAMAQQRVLGVDVSYWNRGSSSATANGITQSDWNTAYSTPNANGFTRQFAFVRATRGGTTGLDQGSGTPSPGGSQSTLSRRYDDPEFLRTMTRATTAGLLAGPYHFGRPDVAGNTGTDEADHFIEYASAYMRPGYLMPMYDWEADAANVDASAQFAIDLSNRIYARMQIRPGVYIGGSRSGTIEGATQSRQDQLAKPATLTPSVTGPAYPMLWNPYYANNSNPESIDVQGTNPKSYYSGFYGPWDDYGNSQPWSFWQYASTVSVPGINNVDSGVDGDVSQGDIEYVKNYLVPAIWWNDTSGDWSTMTNWNSGQPLSTYNASDLNNPPAPYSPHVGDGQTTPFTTYTLPTPRLPGTAGTGPAVTSGVNDTVILERPNANITVTLSSGTYNIRKLYMRETLNITGGSLTINYDPTYRADNSATVLHGGPISAQFSGPVTLSGSGSLTVHTVQLDSAQTFTLAGGTLSFNTINMISNSSTMIAVTGDVSINPLNNATATIKRTSSTGTVDFGGGTRTVTVGDGTNAVDLDIIVPIANGGLIKSGAGTMRLSSTNTYSGGTTLSAGTLALANSGALGTTGTIAFTGGTLQFSSSNTTDYSARFSAAASQQNKLDTNGQSVTLANNLISAGGTLTKLGAGTLTLTGANTYSGATTVSAGTLQIGNGGTTGSLADTGGIVDSSALIFNRSDAYAYGGAISGTGTVTKSGAGTLTLLGANTYTGATTVSAGTLQIGNGGTSGALSGTSGITDNAALVFNRSDAITYSQVISGTGTLTKTGAGTLTLTGANTYTGITTISAGTLQIGNGSTTGSLANTGGIVDNNALIFNRSDAYTYGGVISGTGTVTKSGAGTTTFIGANTYAGATTVSAGTLEIGSGGTSGSLADTGGIVDNGALNFNRSNTYSYGGAISGTGTVTKLGTGTLTLAGANSYAGNTIINNGVLEYTSSANLGSSSNSIVFGGGTLRTLAAGTQTRNITLNAAGGTIDTNGLDSTFSGNITGAGGLTKTSTGTLTLTGANNFGTVTLSSGKLLFNSANTTGAVAVNSSGILGGTGSVSGAATVSSGGHVSPGAGMGPLGVGALTLNTGSVLDIELGAPGVSDLINVTGLLALDGGTVSLTNLGGLDVGTYTLINYGSASGDIANLGAPIGGPSNFNYKLNDTGSAITLSVTIPGDFTNNGSVDASDYVMWRKASGVPSEYETWRSNFGRAAGDGAPALDDNAGVPEPATIAMFFIALLPWAGCRRCRPVR